MSAYEVQIHVEVAAERHRQDELWGEQNHPDGTGPDVSAGHPWHAHHNTWANLAHEARRLCKARAARGEVTWLDIAREEVFEAFAEDDPDRLRAELIQAAAVLVQWVEAIDRRRRQPGWDAVATRAPAPDDARWESLSAEHDRLGGSSVPS